MRGKFMAIVAAGLVALSPASAPAEEPPRGRSGPDAEALARCASAADVSLCLKPVIEASEAGAAGFAAARLLGPQALWAPPPRPDVLASAVAADRRGAAPTQALAPVWALVPADQVATLDWLCGWTARVDDSDGPAYRAWSAAWAPSRPLRLASAERLASLDAAGDGVDIEFRDAILRARMGCYGGLGDDAGVLRMEAALGGAGSPKDGLILTAIGYGRLDEAASLVEAGNGLTDERGVNPLTGAGRSPAEQLLHAAIRAGRADIADRAARIIADRSQLHGLSPALGWLVRRPGREALAPRLADLARRVRPGAAGWRWPAAIAIHRAMIAIGDAAAAKAYEALVWDGQPGAGSLADLAGMRAALLTDDGRWEEAAAEERFARNSAKPGEPYGGFGALAVNRLAADVDFGEAQARLPLHLAHAVSTASRVELLAYCATTAEGSLPLDVAAGCARQLTPLLGADPRLFANPDAANAYFSVAWTAARADSLDLAREMLALGLAHCPMDQFGSKIMSITEVVAIDLHARGKL